MLLNSMEVVMESCCNSVEHLYVYHGVRVITISLIPPSAVSRGWVIVSLLWLSIRTWRAILGVYFGGISTFWWLVTPG